MVSSSTAAARSSTLILELGDAGCSKLPPFVGDELRVIDNEQFGIVRRFKRSGAADDEERDLCTGGRCQQLFARTSRRVELTEVGHAFVTGARATLDAAVLGLLEDVQPNGVASTVIAHERLVAVLGPGHRFAGRRRLRLADLADEAFVDFPSDSPGRSQSDQAFAEAGLTRTVAFESMLVDMMLDLVANDLGIALLAQAVVPEGRGLITVPVTDGPKRVEYLA